MEQVNKWRRAMEQGIKWRRALDEFETLGDQHLIGDDILEGVCFK